MGKKAVFRLCYYLSIVLTILIACTAIAGAFAKYLSPIDGVSFTLFGLFLSVSLIANLFYLIYWLIRWKVWLLIPLIAIASNFYYIQRIFQFSDQYNNQTISNQLTIGTYNVHSFNNNTNGYYSREIAAFLKKEGVDIACFQEFRIAKEFNKDSLRNVFSDWKYSCIPSPHNNQPILQIAIFSKYPIINGELFTYSDSKNCGMWCDLDIYGDTIRLFNIHLQTTSVSQTKRAVNQEIKKENLSGLEKAVYILNNEMQVNFVKRAYQADFVAKQIEQSPYPIILCGDFNSIPSSYAYSTIRGKELIDGFQACGSGYMYTFRYFKHLLRIDYIFTTKEFQGHQYFSPYLDYSDHKPVIMKLSLH